MYQHYWNCLHRHTHRNRIIYSLRPELFSCVHINTICYKSYMAPVLNSTQAKQTVNFVSRTYQSDVTCILVWCLWGPEFTPTQQPIFPIFTKEFRIYVFCLSHVILFLGKIHVYRYPYRHSISCVYIFYLFVIKSFNKLDYVWLDSVYKFNNNNKYKIIHLY